MLTRIAMPWALVTSRNFAIKSHRAAPVAARRRNARQRALPRTPRAIAPAWEPRLRLQPPRSPSTTLARSGIARTSALVTKLRGSAATSARANAASGKSTVVRPTVRGRRAPSRQRPSQRRRRRRSPHLSRDHPQARVPRWTSPRPDQDRAAARCPGKRESATPRSAESTTPPR